MALLVLSLTTVCAKPNKIAKGITFDGKLIKKVPSGHGTLLFESTEKNRDYFRLEIIGDFDGNNITEATMKYMDGKNQRVNREYKIRYNDYHGIKGIAECINSISGNFTYSFDKDWNQIILGFSSIIYGKEKNLDFGELVINRYNGDFTFATNNNEEKVIFLAKSKTLLHYQIELLGYKDTDYLTNYTYYLGHKNNSIDNEKMYKYSLVFLEGVAIKNYFIFYDQAKLIVEATNPRASRTGDEYHPWWIGTYSNPTGDNIRYESEYESIKSSYNYGGYEHNIKGFKIIDKEGTTYSSKDHDYVGKNQLTLIIDYTDGARYEGDVKTDFMDNCHVGLELYNKMKLFTRSDISYYKGRYTSATGEVTEYVDGVTKEEYEKRLQAKEEAKRKHEEERQRQTELEMEKEKREREQYNRTHPLKHRRCNNCQGTGRCLNCNGRGWFIHPMNNERMLCTDCYYKGICPICKGDGIEDYR